MYVKRSKTKTKSNGTGLVISDKKLMARIRSKPLSDREILDLCGNKARLITHDEVSKYSTIDRLLGPNKACIILYVTKSIPSGDVFGHWTCVFKAGWKRKTLYFFDPYGNAPDYCLQYIGSGTDPKYSDYPYLSDLLNDSDYKIEYNDFPLQRHVRTDNICGRLTGLRLLSRNVDGFEFAQVLNQFAEFGFDGDDMATYLTSFIR